MQQQQLIPVGAVVGAFEGTNVGITVGIVDGKAVGTNDGDAVGVNDGDVVGFNDGTTDGATDGTSVGTIIVQEAVVDNADNPIVLVPGPLQQMHVRGAPENA